MIINDVVDLGLLMDEISLSACGAMAVLVR